MKTVAVLNLILLCVVCLFLVAAEATFGKIYRDISYGWPLPMAQEFILYYRSGLLLIPFGWIPSLVLILRTKSPSKRGVFIFQLTILITTMSLTLIILIIGLISFLPVMGAIYSANSNLADLRPSLTYFKTTS